mmetsp:Transcript_337/g.1132  ORF Transcript_337/g.1132 Transcript_337/m.1132 type:complete len:208 (-) Transcript_337:355-978(-)
MYMWLLLSSHSIIKLPPGRFTLTFLSVRPVKLQATAEAHAPVPHANVRPAPLSHTKKSTSPLLKTFINSVLVLCGNVSWFSNIGPTASSFLLRSSNSSLLTNTTAWGLPIPTGTTVQSLPSALYVVSYLPEGSLSVVGTLLGSRMGSPMSTLTRSPSISGIIRPAAVSIFRTFFLSSSSSYANFARQRMPFPHISGSEPSELIIFMV